MICELTVVKKPTNKTNITVSENKIFHDLPQWGHTGVNIKIQYQITTNETMEDIHVGAKIELIRLVVV